MTQAQQEVKRLCDTIYSGPYKQVVIDFVQDEVEELLNGEEKPTRDAVSAASYHADILLELANPALEKDMELLSALKTALDAWSNEIENVNRILGLPLES